MARQWISLRNASATNARLRGLAASISRFSGWVSTGTSASTNPRARWSRRRTEHVCVRRHAARMPRSSAIACETCRPRDCRWGWRRFSARSGSCSWPPAHPKPGVSRGWSTAASLRGCPPHFSSFTATPRYGSIARQLPNSKQLFEPLLDVLADRVADDVVRAAQLRQRLRVGELSLLHYDRRLDVPLRAAQQGVGIVVLQACDDDDATAGAVAELLGPHLHVDHQIAVRLADANHRRRRQHVEHHLGGGAGFQARRSRDHFRTDRRRDGEVDERLQLGAWIVGDEDDLRARLAGAGEGATDELRHAARRDA